MESFYEYIAEYKKQLEKGDIKKAYRGLIGYIMELKTYLKNKYPGYFVSGSMYYGYMDMTYFSFNPKLIENRKLRIAIVFIHETCRFEVWLAGFNKQVQSEYWKLITENHWDKYHVVPTTKGVDSIIEHILVGDPDFSDLDALTKIIEKETIQFIKDVEGFLSKH